MAVDGGYIATPGGVGKFVEFDPTTGEVTVLMDYTYLVVFPGDQCFPLKGVPLMTETEDKLREAVDAINIAVTKLVNKYGVPTGVVALGVAFISGAVALRAVGGDEAVTVYLRNISELLSHQGIGAEFSLTKKLR